MLLGGHKRRESAWASYFKGLMHAADARYSVEHENWIPATVSIYYAVFDLTLSILLARNYNPRVKFRDKKLILLDEAIRLGEEDPQKPEVEDPYILISHELALKFARENLDPAYVKQLERLKELRTYASYRPSIYLDETGRTVVKLTDPQEFINEIRQITDQVMNIFRIFHDHLMKRDAMTPEDSKRLEILESEITIKAGEAIKHLGRFRTKRAIDIAENIHYSFFQRVTKLA